MRERSSPTGRLTLRLIDPRTGTIELERRVDNLVTLTGRRLLADLLRGAIDLRTPGSIWIVAGWNAADTDPNLADEALSEVRLETEAEVGEPEQLSVDGSPRIVTAFTATFDADLSGQDIELNEAGIQLVLPSPTAPVLYNRVRFGPITKTATLQMTLSWEVIF